jgi:hypothetical protein
MTEKITAESIRAWAAKRNLLLTPGSAHIGSREVSFGAALAWAGPYLARHKDLPVFGSPEWAAEPDQRRKTAAAVQAALLWSVHVENRQAAAAEASSAVSAAIDWRQESKHIGYRISPSYIPRKRTA